MRIVLFILLVFPTSHSAECRSIMPSFSPIPNSMANRINGTHLVRQELKTTTVTCDLSYSFLPCTTGLLGKIFLIVVYEFLLGYAANYVNSGSELFFRMFGTGIFSSSLFQILGSLPSVIIMLVSSVSSSADTVETTAAMEMAMLTGSAVYSLTMVWGSIVAFGSRSISKTSTSSITSFFKCYDHFLPSGIVGFGVETDTETKKIARIMFVSMIPFLMLQLAKIINSTTGTKIVVSITLGVTVILLIANYIVLVFRPWIQEKSFAYITSKYSGNSAFRSLCMVDGKPSESRIKEVFRKIDQNNDSKVSKAELYAFLLGLQMEGADVSTNDYAVAMMTEFDESHDSSLSETEFVQGIAKWLDQGTLPSNSLAQDRAKSKSRSNTSTGTTEGQERLLSQQDATSKPRSALAVSWNYAKAGFLIILGTTMMIILGSPLMQSFEDVASDLNMPSFFVSYVMLPLAMSYKQVLQAITSARKKTLKDISGPMSEVYRGVYLNNLTGLATFLSLVLIKDLSWNVSAEVLVVLLICSSMGVLTSFCTEFPLWTSFLAYSLYPISILLLYVLTSVLGWS
ncbi:hypothetical protein BT93_L1499 [Corymbia citriodora subsp. variegata]|uniref:EF-hand domain-containing protein n=1 Tax=Corymbia citriodora subsp. variegata TaxID=360336 RepID=A0A8T0CME2_CORYI|nr:hypothetical protein BT93_L1499 [Corymbia citriodora subsp. variegata]